MADCYVGEIRPFAGNYVPDGWLPCDGRLLSISSYEVLYSLLGTAFGGDGRTTFGIPDLRGRLPIGTGLGTGLTNRSFASSGGSESVSLALSQTPAHSHAFNVGTGAATQNSPANNLYANPAPNVFYATTATPGSAAQVLSADTIGASGGGNLLHENRMPALAINYMIATNGIYPQPA
ncbi:phage tail protein [Methylomonas fluvii]|uniref:Phage tail protein n=1 Tax=Methylomonas fluvii TaxID=1854564 RepID=A0ABR9DI38_9GAMM|nr:tail fiber protein [Methylomonas fluvii]MBD9362471.1 phage tail protein [Methylomonas fluvii]